MVNGKTAVFVKIILRIVILLILASSCCLSSKTTTVSGPKTFPGWLSDLLGVEKAELTKISFAPDPTNTS